MPVVHIIELRDSMHRIVFDPAGLRLGGVIFVAEEYNIWLIYFKPNKAYFWLIISWPQHKVPFLITLCP
jgi:hypothetical protein